MPRVRVHQHVNPLAPFYRRISKPIDIERVFADPDLPLHLDVGCGRGRFLLHMASAQPAWNFLGVEIREPLVTEANQIAAEEDLPNLHYAFCNAMLWLDKLIESVPDGVLQTVTIQFPDPWFKKKHVKRRMVNKELVAAVVSKLAEKGEIFLQTDIEFLAGEMFEMFGNDARLEEKSISKNPFDVKTEREKAVENRSLPIFRTLFVKV